MKESTINEINMIMGEENLQTVIDKALLPAKEKIHKVYGLCVEGQLDEAIKLCEEILKIQPDFPEIEYLLAQCLYYFQGQENLQRAEAIMKKLRKQTPDDEEVLTMSGKICHALGDYPQARSFFSKVCPLKKYQPFVYQLYGDTLQHMGQPDKALPLFHADLEQYRKTGQIPHVKMLDGSFQNTLLLDIEWNVGQFSEDLDLYKHFLDQIGDESDAIQMFISDTVIMISHELSRKWLCAPFKQFLDFLNERNILKGECELTVYSGYISLESYYIREDRRVSSFVEDYFSNICDVIYDERQKKITGENGSSVLTPYADKETLYMNRTKYLTYNWYMSRYFQEHIEEMDYVQAAYPHTWDMAAENLEKIKVHPDQYRKGLEAELASEMEKHSPGSAHGSNEEEIKDGLEKMYHKAVNTSKEPMQLGAGGTYHRGGIKVGRNDPCPCGSGKKYKKCCGKGL